MQFYGEEAVSVEAIASLSGGDVSMSPLQQAQGLSQAT